MDDLTIYREAQHDGSTRSRFEVDAIEMMVVEVVPDYEKGAKAMDYHSHGWLSVTDDGDVEAFRVGFDVALTREDTDG